MSAEQPSDGGVPSARRLVDGATRLLTEAGVLSPRADATALAVHLLGTPLVLAPTPPPDGFATRYAALVERRRLREPLQHIVGVASFRRLTLHVEPGVFVPRPETETVAQHVVDEARRMAGTSRPGPAAARAEVLVVDLCCGTGAIGLAVADEVPAATVVTVDVDPRAVRLTERNRRAVGVTGLTVRLGDVRDPDLLADLAGRVDVVVANPPYIPSDQVPVDPEVRDHDPDLALYGGGPDGLDLPRAVVGAAARLLRPGGLLVMEHAEVQDAAARATAAAAGLVDVATAPDLTGRPRTLLARRPGPGREVSEGAGWEGPRA